MKHNSYINDQKIFITLQTEYLDTKTLTKDSAFPMIGNNINSVVMNLDKVTNIDATGISWLVEFAERLSKLGTQLYITETSAAYNIVLFLGLEKLLPSAKNLDHKQAI